MCARMGLVTRKGFAGIVKHHYPRWVLVVLVLLSCPAFLLNIGADLALLGGVGNILMPVVPAALWSVVLVVVFLVVLLSVSWTRLLSTMKYVCLILLVYAVVPFLSHQDLADIARHTLIPSFSLDRGFLLAMTGIGGAIVSPYVFFWQTSTEVEELGGTGQTYEQRTFMFFNMRRDILYGAFFAVLIMYFTMLTAGTVLHNANIHTIETIRDATLALEPVAGRFSSQLFALGALATGLIIIPVLSGSIAYIVSEVCGTPHGFARAPSEAKSFYGTIIGVLAIGLVVPLAGVNPIKALLATTVMYGVTAPFLILLILHICNNRNIMGDRTNSTLSNVFGVTLFILLAASGTLLLGLT